MNTTHQTTREVLNRMAPLERKIFAGELLEYLTARRLSPRQAFILKHRIGWRCESLTLNELAAVLSITRERVRQIERHIYALARHYAVWGWVEPWTEHHPQRLKWSKVK